MLVHSVYGSSKISERDSKKLFGLSLKLNKPHYLPLQKITYSYEGERSAILEQKKRTSVLCSQHALELFILNHWLWKLLRNSIYFMDRISLVSGLGHALHLVSTICPVFSLNSITNFSGWGALSSVRMQVFAGLCVSQWNWGLHVIWAMYLWCQQLKRLE